MSASEAEAGLDGAFGEELESHLVEPGTQNALCGEPVTAAWNWNAPQSAPDVTCSQCRLQRYWLPASGELERDAELDVVVEPWPARRRRHVTGDDDPGRGRLHRPASLQVCLECGELRGPYGDYDNLCGCDSRSWDRKPSPRAGDLSDNVAFCRSCLSALAPGSTRWTSFYCDDCRPQVIMLNKLAQRCVVPIGPHSIMNGVFATPDPQLSEAQLISFSDQLTTFFQHSGNLHERTSRRVRARLEEFGVTEHAISADDYFERCAATGWDAERGFIDFVMSLDESLNEDAARELWNVPSEYGGGARASGRRRARLHREVTEGQA